MKVCAISSLKMSLSTVGKNNLKSDAHYYSNNNVQSNNQMNFTSKNLISCKEYGVILKALKELEDGFYYVKEYGSFKFAPNIKEALRENASHELIKVISKQPNNSGVGLFSNMRELVSELPFLENIVFVVPGQRADQPISLLVANLPIDDPFKKEFSRKELAIKLHKIICQNPTLNASDLLNKVKIETRDIRNFCVDEYNHQIPAPSDVIYAFFNNLLNPQAKNRNIYKYA